MSQQTILAWTRGLIGAAINSAAVGGMALVVDNHDFNPAEGGWRKLGAVVLVSSVTGAMLYLKQHPLPGE
jgi:hypothetical protein